MTVALINALILIIYLIFKSFSLEAKNIFFKKYLQFYFEFGVFVDIFSLSLPMIFVYALLQITNFSNENLLIIICYCVALALLILYLAYIGFCVFLIK
jgi:hypothetical protein